MYFIYHIGKCLGFAYSTRGSFYTKICFYLYVFIVFKSINMHTFPKYFNASICYSVVIIEYNRTYHSAERAEMAEMAEKQIAKLLASKCLCTNSI